MQHVAEYFETARTRYAIRQNRLRGQEKPWTDDVIFQNWRFCNVHREHDTTTEWFAQSIRNNLDGMRAVEATVVFRWFNRIETGARIKDLLLGGWDTEEARRRLTGVSPVVTGAYIIKGPTGLSKLEGILLCIDWALARLRRDYPTGQINWSSQEEAWKYFKSFEYLGGFMAYEVVSDLRWVPNLWAGDFNLPRDVMSWANAGPGCARGLSRVLGKPIDHFNDGSKRDQAEMLDLMMQILEHAYDPNYWPQDWRRWEMREVEHWSCEFDKYMRVKDGERMKQRYQGRY